MYRAILIDDEPWALRGLANGIRWEDYQIEICYQSTDAAKALAAIIEKKPDLVITDIHMPKLSGLDLICTARECGAGCKFIIFSGFSEFEYARQAIQYGVFAYLLKPLNKPEFCSTLKLMQQSFETERGGEDALIWEGTGQTQAEGFSFGESNCAVTCHMTGSDKPSLDLALEGLPFFSQKTGSDRYLYVVGTAGDTVLRKLEEWLSLAARKDKEYISCGVSREFRDMGEAKAAMRESEIAAQEHFMDASKGIHMPIYPHPEKCDAYVRGFKELLAQGAQQEVQLLLRELPAHCRKQGLNILDFCSLFNQITAAIENQYGGKGGIDNEPLSYRYVTQRFFKGPDQAVNFLLSVYEESRQEAAQHAVQNTAADTMEKILVYIKAHYNREINLSLLSETFFLNMTYICDLFKKNLDTTFSKYLTNLRLERAYALIRDTDQSLMDVAECVGYRDYYYFIKQFKKKYAMTPGQFQKEQKGMTL